MTWIPWVLALAGLGYLVGLTAWLGLASLSFPYQLDYGEGLLLHFTNEWAHGRPIYGPIGSYPYITANYPPLTIVLALALKPVLGMTYTAGRVWTVLAIVASAILIAVWVRQEGRRWLPALAAGLAFAGSPYVFHWAPLFRVDLVGLALTLAGLFAVHLCSTPNARGTQAQDSHDPSSQTSPPRVGGQEGGHRHLIWLAALLFVAGLYAKQSYLFAPAAAIVYLFFFGVRRQAIQLGAGMAVLGGGLFLLINALTSGGFWQGLVVSNVNPFLWVEFRNQLGDFFGTFTILGLGTVWYVVDKFILDRATPLRDKAHLLDLYLPGALLSLLLTGKAGAWENYFFEALAAIALCSGLGLARLGRHAGWAFRLVAPLLVLAQVVLMWHTPRVAERYLELTRSSNQAIQPLLAQTADPIISEDMGLLVTNGKVLDYCSFQYSQLARAGRWDQAWELGQLRDRRLSAVILEEGTRLDVDRYQRFTREFLSELDRNYRRAYTVGKYEWYKPDPLQHEERAEFGDQLALVGWSLHAPVDIGPGDTFSLTVVWQAEQAMETSYTAFAHLVDGNGFGLSGDDHIPYDGLYSTSAWGAGEMVRDTFNLETPEDAPSGPYEVLVGWYDPGTGQRLSVGEGDSVRLAVLPVDWSATSPQAVKPLGQRFGETINLEGFSLAENLDGFQVTLRWSTDAYLDTDYTVFLHLVEPANASQVLAQGDGPPLGGRWPTSLWLPGVALDDLHTVPLPPDLAPGMYNLLVGLYDPLTGMRLPLADGDDSLVLAEIDLTE